MDFSFTEEQQSFRKSLKGFCEEKISPKIRAIDGKGEIPRGILDDMASFGLLGITVSEEYGGSGADFMTAAIAAEEIAHADISMALPVYYLVEAAWGFLIERYGTSRAKEEILPDVTNGKKFLGIASTEVGAGSDIANISTVMEKDDEKMTVKGTKTFISGVREAVKSGGGYVTLVKTDPELGHGGLSLCYLPVKEIPGITTETFSQMGRDGISTGLIAIHGAELPAYYLIGKWNRGFYHIMEGFNCARTLVAAACIGAAQRVLESGIGHLRKRKAFRKPLAEFEGLQFELAENYTRLESARLLVYKAAWMLDRMYGEARFNPREINVAVASAKLVAPTVAFDLIKDVLTWYGAVGYMKEAGIERGLRGVASYIIGAEGAQNIMKLIISREILGREFVS